RRGVVDYDSTGVRSDSMRRLSTTRGRAPSRAVGQALAAAAERELARQEARAARSVGEHERAAGVDAGDRALDRGAVGKHELHRLALVGMALLPLGGDRRETVQIGRAHV